MYACIYTTTGIHTTILYVPYNLFFQYVVTFYLSFIKLKMTRKRRGSRSCNYVRHRKRQRNRVTDLEKGRTGGAAPPPLHDFFDDSDRSTLESDLASKNRARRSSSSPKSTPGAHSKASDGRTELIEVDYSVGLLAMESVNTNNIPPENESVDVTRSNEIPSPPEVEIDNQDTDMKENNSTFDNCADACESHNLRKDNESLFSQASDEGSSPWSDGDSARLKDFMDFAFPLITTGLTSTVDEQKLLDEAKRRSIPVKLVEQDIREPLISVGMKEGQGSDILELGHTDENNKEVESLKKKIDDFNTSLKESNRREIILGEEIRNTAIREKALKDDLKKQEKEMDEIKCKLAQALEREQEIKRNIDKSVNGFETDRKYNKQQNLSSEESEKIGKNGMKILKEKIEHLKLKEEKIRQSHKREVNETKGLVNNLKKFEKEVNNLQRHLSKATEREKKLKENNKREVKALKKLVKEFGIFKKEVEKVKRFFTKARNKGNETKENNIVEIDGSFEYLKRFQKESNPLQDDLSEAIEREQILKDDQKREVDQLKDMTRDIKTSEKEVNGLQQDVVKATDNNVFNLKEFVNLDDNILEFNYLLLLSKNSSMLRKTFCTINAFPVEAENHTADLYDKYLYVHVMIPGIKHALSAVGNPRKEQFKSSMCEICFTQTVIHVDVTSRMFYCYNNFKLHPHGTSFVNDKVELESVVTSIGNNYEKNALSIIKSSEIRNTNYNPIKVCYPGSTQI